MSPWRDTCLEQWMESSRIWEECPRFRHLDKTNDDKDPEVRLKQYRMAQLDR